MIDTGTILVSDEAAVVLISKCAISDTYTCMNLERKYIHDLFVDISGDELSTYEVTDRSMAVGPIIRGLYESHLRDRPNDLLFFDQLARPISKCPIHGPLYDWLGKLLEFSTHHGDHIWRSVFDVGDTPFIDGTITEPHCMTNHPISKSNTMRMMIERLRIISMHGAVAKIIPIDDHDLVLAQLSGRQFIYVYDGKDFSTQV